MKNRIYADINYVCSSIVIYADTANLAKHLWLKILLQDDTESSKLQNNWGFYEVTKLVLLPKVNTNTKHFMYYTYILYLQKDRIFKIILGS